MKPDPNQGSGCPRRSTGYDPPRLVLDRARRGDPEAIQEIASGLLPHVLRAVSALLGPQHPDVEDVVQEVVLSVLHALPSFRGESTLLHFAIRFTTRRVTRVRRRSRAILGWLEHWHRSELPLSPTAPSPHAQTLGERRRQILRELLAQIPEAQAEAFLLRVALDCSLEDVAAITKAPVNTVRSRIRLAKAALREVLERDPRCAELLTPGDDP